MEPSGILVMVIHYMQYITVYSHQELVEPLKSSLRNLRVAGTHFEKRCPNIKQLCITGILFYFIIPSGLAVNDSINIRLDSHCLHTLL